MLEIKNMSMHIQNQNAQSTLSGTNTPDKIDLPVQAPPKAVTYASEEQTLPVSIHDENESPPTSTPKVAISPLPLDQIISHVNNFGVKIDSLETKLTENKGASLRMEQL